MTTSVRPVGPLTADQVESVLIAATSAPSRHNDQPWRFRCTATTIELSAPQATSQETLLACGAALLNLRLAIRALGVYPDVRILPVSGRPQLLAVVRPEGHHAATPDDRLLAQAIPRRRTNRHPAVSVTVPASILNELHAGAEIERAWLATLTPAQLPQLKAIAHRARLAQGEDHTAARDWKSWTGRTVTTIEPRDEWILQNAEHGAMAADETPERPSPLIVVIGSFQDLPADRIQAGQALQRVLLIATTAGLSASFLPQLLQESSTRRELRDLLGGGMWPQTVLRLGHRSPVPASSRKHLDEVTLTDEQPVDPARNGRSPATDADPRLDGPHGEQCGLKLHKGRSS
ncbi:hypothetical protein [Amycolatopsis sp. H20-H5]|uniref:hypothetical protein n=1 Tax=Amycolatopsis sp. H20-H5 TaxID=3046309 RepID=UPI002DB7F736|nr:hypothetical protein [Amycolatopsis sp. H20-H5]MEC3982599.1 hypothetical protein [Amycolatopsis sp. H20-H5]